MWYGRTYVFAMNSVVNFYFIRSQLWVVAAGLFLRDNRKV